MNIEEQLLATSIRNTIREADRAVTSLSNLMEACFQTSDQEDEQDELEDAEITVRALVEKIYREVGILAERLNLPHFRSEVADIKASFKDLAALEPTRWDVTLLSLPLSAARTLFKSLAVMTEGRDVTGLGVFETILSNTAKIIDISGLAPNNETVVRNRVLEILQLAFPDATKEISIQKTFKVYKPDIGVGSLMAAAEYKFANTKEKAKAALDGIYADMRGYSGHSDWRSFYAVIYLTGPFYTQKDVEREFRLVNADLSWIPIIVYGPMGSNKSDVG